MCYSGMVERDLKKLVEDYDAIVDDAAFTSYEEATRRDSKRYPAVAARFFPGHYAPVLHPGADGRLVIEPMRYGVHPPRFVQDPKKYSAFNARRDNLTSAFWGDAFGRHHGFVELRAFYEWVAVSDLLKAKVVTLKEVEAEFARQSAERKAKILAAGKKYKPTPTEQKDPRFRQIVIEFETEAPVRLLVPVIFSAQTQPDGRLDKGFAIVTDEPQPTVSAAGHDRSPIFLERATLAAWLTPQGKTAEELTALLGRQLILPFTHKVAEAA